MLCQRSFLHMLRSLLTDEGEELPRTMAPFDNKLMRLQESRPSKISMVDSISLP